MVAIDSANNLVFFLCGLSPTGTRVYHLYIELIDGRLGLACRSCGGLGPTVDK
jgi:hypothetical protein